MQTNWDPFRIAGWDPVWSGWYPLTTDLQNDLVGEETILKHGIINLDFLRRLNFWKYYYNRIIKIVQCAVKSKTCTFFSEPRVD